MAKKRERVIRKLTIADAVSEAFGEFTALGEEMREWADNIEEKFSATQKFADITDAADALESLSEPTVADSLANAEIEVVDPPQRRRGYSRADRLSHAVDILQYVIGWIDDLDEKDARKDAADDLRNDVDDLIGEAEGVSFPGMYG